MATRTEQGDRTRQPLEDVEVAGGRQMSQSQVAAM